MKADCWLFLGGKNPDGYGMFKRRGAHRIAYETFIGPIPDGLNVLHSCDVPSCINPKHLWVGTQNDNVQDCIRKGRRRYVGPRADRLGEDCLLAKFTWDIIRKMRREYIKCKNISELSRRFGMSTSQGWKIIHNKQWGEA